MVENASDKDDHINPCATKNELHSRIQFVLAIKSTSARAGDIIIIGTIFSFQYWQKTYLVYLDFAG